MRQRIRVIVIVLGVSMGCQSQKESTTEYSAGEVSQVGGDENESGAEVSLRPARNLKSILASGLYRGGLRLATQGNKVSGYYEDASGWNDEARAPQFSCEYSFSGEYTGSDTILLSLAGYDSATGTLEVMPGNKIRVSLSLDPCENEEASTTTWEIEEAYQLVAIKSITAPKSHFYSTPGDDSRRKAYLVKGDRAEITSIEGEWYQVIYRGTKATTEGWMQASSFEQGAPVNPLSGRWLSKPGEAYEVFYDFYSNNRYKTWDINSFEPQGMTGSFAVVEPGMISLEPCGKAPSTMRFRTTATGEVSIMIPGTETWTAFEKQSREAHVEEAGFSIEKREIVTSVGGRTIHIPSSVTKAQFLNAVCPFEITPDQLSVGEGTFDILRVSTVEKGQLFYAILDGDQVGSLVVETPVVHRKGIAVGATFGELKKAIPSVTVTRSEMEGKVVGSNEHFTFLFGYLDGELFDEATKSIPDTVTIRRIIL